LLKKLISRISKDMNLIGSKFNCVKILKKE